jgi:glycosyltransferase involved in cell wall biosynthesis
MMKLTFVTATLTSGGSERVMSIVANKMQERGYEVEIICLNDQIVFYPINEGIKITHVEVEAGTKSLPKKLWWFRKHIQKTQPDVVIAFMVSVYTVTLLALMGIDIPVISSVRNDPAYSNIRKKITRKLLLPRSAHVVVQTQQIKKFFNKSIQNMTTVIYNPVNEKVFKLQPSKKENRIISVGRLYPQKDQKTMIEAFAKMSEHHPDWKLVIFGEGPERDSLERMIKDPKSKIQDKVFLPGRSENIIDELNKSKIFCLSSIYEGMSNALVEAICVGLPIVTTKVSGTEELIKNGENGFIVNIGDKESMAKALTKIIEDENLQNQFAEKNKAQAIKFETNTIVNQWEDLVNSVVRLKVKG